MALACIPTYSFVDFIEDVDWSDKNWADLIKNFYVRERTARVSICSIEEIHKWKAEESRTGDLQYCNRMVRKNSGSLKIGFLVTKRTT